MTVDDARSRMVARQLAARGISDRRVLDAFRTIPRELFIAPALADFAYDDRPLPIGKGQTISQPYIVALMVEALCLQSTDRVLEIGTGSGYAAAILSRVAAEVFSIEWHEELAAEARERLAELGCRNVEIRHGDGTLGWAAHAPYDGIAVAAGGREIPRALLDQLGPGGRMLIPVGAEETSQVLLRMTRRGQDDFQRESLGDVRFVPLLGASHQ